MVRVAFTGVSHWHAPMYYGPAARSAGMKVVAVSDPDRQTVERVSSELGAAGFVDDREMLDRIRPDLVFAFGRHCDMAATAEALIDTNTPFILEKPGGLNYGEVSAIRDRAKAKGLYAGVGFNFRAGEMCQKIQELIGEEPVHHCSFRFIAGGPYRYHETGCGWMLDPALSGGGSTINLSIHFVDMFKLFSRTSPTEVTSLMGNFTWDLPIEDYSSMILRSPSSVCTIETGYTFPSKFGVFDLRFSIRTDRHYLVVRGDNVLEIHRAADSRLQEVPIETSNMLMYPPFVTGSVDRFKKGLPPFADLDDLASAMQVVDAAFASSKAGGRPVTS